jgi:hypothetical protein
MSNAKILKRSRRSGYLVAKERGAKAELHDTLTGLCVPPAIRVDRKEAPPGVVVVKPRGMA